MLQYSALCRHILTVAVMIN